jgi:hypothetical protein
LAAESQRRELRALEFLLLANGGAKRAELRARRDAARERLGQLSTAAAAEVERELESLRREQSRLGDDGELSLEFEPKAQGVARRYGALVATNALWLAQQVLP